MTIPHYQNPDADPNAPHDDTLCQHVGPYCPGCRQEASNIASVTAYARMEGESPKEWVRKNEGTYNPNNDHFLCDKCFISEEDRRGVRLAAPLGKWVCP